ncbi:hypothetical protein O988_05043 [Pseudogymnoascus sp. VKM F-3808]|nr:hypothetical protein O988_05043 [Pseudogymnoascus sp. VKM F-3808]
MTQQDHKNYAGYTRIHKHAQNRGISPPVMPGPSPAYPDLSSPNKQHNMTTKTGSVNIGEEIKDGDMKSMKKPYNIAQLQKIVPYRAYSQHPLRGGNNYRTRPAPPP